MLHSLDVDSASAKLLLAQHILPGSEMNIKAEI